MASNLLARWLEGRHALKALDRLAAAQEEQTALLRRLVDQVCGPVVVPPSEQDLRRETGASYTREAELAKVEAFRAQVYADSGREPSDDEIAAFLDGVPV